MSCPGDAGSATEPAAALSDAGREARPPPRVLHQEGARAHPAPPVPLWGGGCARPTAPACWSRGLPQAGSRLTRVLRFLSLPLPPATLRPACWSQIRELPALLAGRC